MIKAITSDGALVVLGLSRANCEKLLEGKPIFVGQEHLAALRQKILICAGETEDAIKGQLASVLPPGAADAPSPKPGEVVKVTRERTTVEPAPDPDELARRARLSALEDELEQTRRALTLLG
ncbi:MAG: hypothetical protein ACJ79R_20580, partial [Anaeromyxobacteraceae bacterium]